jgi:hypothetical protein
MKKVLRFMRFGLASVSDSDLATELTSRSDSQQRLILSAFSDNLLTERLRSHGICCFKSGKEAEEQMVTVLKSIGYRVFKVQSVATEKSSRRTVTTIKKPNTTSKLRGKQT